ncbi:MULTISPECIES: ABC transporter ATP-binding protein [unclassified Novosphingobium]|uniref:ABC transporter ATP-binding protein n=1 Tax=unclassified Novosphingobium TaxID=2644732 RepID=UPI00135A73EC|nr:MULTISPECIES: ABC transporter ATP-binding protein [unclassified Novosphingobium]
MYADHPVHDDLPGPPPLAPDQMRMVASLARPHARSLALVAGLTLASSATTLTIPWLAGNLAGKLIEAGPLGTARLVVLLVLAFIASAALAAVVQIVSGNTAARILADLRARLYDHLQSLPVGWHVAHRQGDVLALMTTEVGHLGHFLTGTLVGVPPLLLTAAGAALLMLRIDASLALLVPLLIPIYVILLKLVGRRLRELAEREQNAEAQVLALAEDNLGAISAIKGFAREDLESARYRRRVETARLYAVRLTRIQSIVEPVSALVASLAALGLLMMIGDHLHQGRLSGQELFSFLFYAALLTRPVSELAETWGQVQVTRGTLARMASVLATAPEPGYALPSRLPPLRGAIRFEKVDFAYPGRSRVLRGFDLDIAAGEKIAILGDNGAGKTTIVALLLRLYECQSGRITLDGNDITEVSVQDLRAQISVVPQRAQLLSGTVRENIAFGRHGASRAEIEEAARRADAWDFVTALPQGFDTQIGDRGVRLSGGQGQRIALARALLKDAPIVVLDEATSMYDPHGEERFVETCTRILQDKTVVIITHRPASVALADRVVRI